MTVYAVHYARYSPALYAISDDVMWRKVASGAAFVSGLVAGAALLLIAVFDTYEFHDTHAITLLICLFGLAGCMCFTTAVWWDMTWWVRKERSGGVRKW